MRLHATILHTAASLGVEDLAAFRQRVNVPGANSSSGGFAILPECAARCAALQAAGQAEPPAQPEPANNYSMSFDSINPPNVNVPTGSISSISASAYRGGREGCSGLGMGGTAARLLHGMRTADCSDPPSPMHAMRLGANSSLMSAGNVPGMPKMKNGGVSLNRVVYKPCTAIVSAWSTERFKASGAGRAVQPAPSSCNELPIG